MRDDLDFSLAWIKTGAFCGLAGIGCYLAAAFAPLPETLTLAMAFAFGPLLAIGAVGLYHALALDHRGPLVQIATLFAVGGAFTLLIMLATQQAIFALQGRALAATADPDAKARLEVIGDGLNAVHFGIDIAWDVLISSAIVLFGVAMLRHPRFGRIFGALGVVAGALLIVYNLRYFPVPPAGADSIDWGPACALWLLAAFALMLRVPAWARTR